MLALGEAHTKAGDFLQASNTFQRTADLARTLGTSEALARAALGFQEARWRPGLPGEPGVHLLEEALQPLPGELIAPRHEVAHEPRERQRGLLGQRLLDQLDVELTGRAHLEDAEPGPPQQRLDALHREQVEVVERQHEPHSTTGGASPGVPSPS